MTTATQSTPSTYGGSWFPIGRSFVNPFFDLMLIGGGLSLLTVLGLYLTFSR